MDLPVWSTLHMGALSLVIAAMAVALRFRLATVTVLAICALAGLTLLFAGVA